MTGLPADVTADEIAAIAAAAEAVKEKFQEVSQETASSNPPGPEETPKAGEQVAPKAFEEETADDAVTFASAHARLDAIVEASPEAPAANLESNHASHEEEVSAALASLMPQNGNGSESADLVTTAHASVSTQEEAVATVAEATASEVAGPRWIATEVSVDENESLAKLEEEMKQAYAGFAAADAARMVLGAARASFNVNYARSESAHESPADPSAVSAVSQPEPVGNEPEAATPVDAERVTQAAAESVTPPDQSAPESAAEAVPPTPAEGPQPEAAFAAAASAGTAYVVSPQPVEAVAETQPIAETPQENPRASEIVPARNSELAAAWASWKQVRESVAAPELTSQIAEAASAGFHEIRREESNKPEERSSTEEATSDDSGAIASIVDSVLAELKPRLMEEISRKMGKDKKK